MVEGDAAVGEVEGADAEAGEAGTAVGGVVAATGGEAGMGGTERRSRRHWGAVGSNTCIGKSEGIQENEDEEGWRAWVRDTSVHGRSDAKRGVSALAVIDGDLYRECCLRTVVLDEDTCCRTCEGRIVEPCRLHLNRAVGFVPNAADATLDGVGVGKLFKKATAMDGDLPAWQAWLLMD